MLGALPYFRNLFHVVLIDIPTTIVIFLLQT